MICVFNKESRAVQIGGELDRAVTRPGYQPLTAHDTENAAQAGELLCGFEAEGGTLVVAAGCVSTDRPAEAAIKFSSRLINLRASGGFNAIIAGTTFTGPDGSVEIEVTGPATGGGESPACPATLTL